MKRSRYNISAGRVFSGTISGPVEEVQKIFMVEESMLKIEGDGRGISIKCAEGVISLTQPDDSIDHVLHPGETFMLDRKGLVIVYALTNTRLEMILQSACRYGSRPADISAQGPVGWKINFLR